MKLLTLLSVLVVLSGCATGSKFMRGFGQGMSQNFNSETLKDHSQRRNTACTSTVYGNQVNTYCN